VLQDKPKSSQICMPTHPPHTSTTADRTGHNGARGRHGGSSGGGGSSSNSSGSTSTVATRAALDQRPEEQPTQHLGAAGGGIPPLHPTLPNLLCIVPILTDVSEETTHEGLIPSYRAARHDTRGAGPCLRSRPLYVSVSSLAVCRLIFSPAPPHPALSPLINLCYTCMHTTHFFPAPLSAAPPGAAHCAPALIAR